MIGTPVASSRARISFGESFSSTMISARSELPCAQKHRRERDFERQPLRLQLAAGIDGLGNAFLGEIGILPAGEEILQIPFALAVTYQHEKTIAHSIIPFRL